MNKKDWLYIKKLGGQGILKQEDVADLENQRAKVLYLMLDGFWHSAQQVIDASGGREGLRRMRELREIPHVTIERSSNDSLAKRDFRYRLNYDPNPQANLF